MKKISCKTGGKLYVAGEYSILTTGQTAIINHIPIYMTATVSSSESVSIYSDMFDYAVGIRPDSNYGLIQESIRTFFHYLNKTIDCLPAFSLSIKGKMEQEGKKYGIGSSGSVVVLTIKSLMTFYNIDFDNDLIFRLATYTLLKLGDNGSMGDIACISYGCLIAYTSFDRVRLVDLMRQKKLSEILVMDWGYKIIPLIPQLSADFLVGWTKQPAISSQMINDWKSSIDAVFLNETQSYVEKAIKAIENNQKELLKTTLNSIGELLSSLNPAIYTSKLTLLKESSRGLDVVAKSSGAGGGDCGIAISFDKNDTKELIKRWEQVGIQLLYQENWKIH